MQHRKIFGLIVSISMIIVLLVGYGITAAEEEGTPVYYADTWTWPYQPDLLSHLSQGRFYVPVQDDGMIAVIDPDAEDYGLQLIPTDYVQPHHPWTAPGMRYVWINFQSEGKGDHDAFGVLDTFSNEITYVNTGVNDPFHGSFSPTANLLINSDLDNNAGHVYLWDSMAPGAAPLAIVETTGMRTRDILISHDGKYAFIGHQGYDPDNGVVGAVDILDIEAREIVGSLGEGRCRSGKMSNDGSLAFFSCDRANKILVIDVATLEIVTYIDTGEGSGPFNISFRADDKFAYVGLSAAGQLGVIDVEALELVARLDSGTDTNSTYFHPTAPLAVVTNDGTDSHVSILNTETNTIDYTIETGGKGTHNGQWSADGRWFLVGNRLGDSVTLLSYNADEGTIEWYDDITVGFGTNGVHWVPYFCGVEYLTDMNVADVQNAAPSSPDGTC